MSSACLHGHYPGCLCAHLRALHDLSAAIFTSERGPPSAVATAAINSLSSAYKEKSESVDRLIEGSANGRELRDKACRDASSPLWFEQDDTEQTDSSVSSESSGPEANALSPGTEEEEEFERARRAARDIVARSIRQQEAAPIVEIEIEEIEDAEAEGDVDAEGEPDDETIIYLPLETGVYEAAAVDPAYDGDSDEEEQDTLSADRSSFDALSEVLRRGQGERPRRNSGAPAPQSACSWRAEGVANDHSGDSVLETEEES